MIKSTIQNIRTKVDKRQIIQYLTLRSRILNYKIMNPSKDEDLKTLKKRYNELSLLIGVIRNDTIDKKIREMHQYIHGQNDYRRKLKEEKKAGSIICDILLEKKNDLILCKLISQNNKDITERYSNIVDVLKKKFIRDLIEDDIKLIKIIYKSEIILKELTIIIKDIKYMKGIDITNGEITRVDYSKLLHQKRRNILKIHSEFYGWNIFEKLLICHVCKKEKKSYIVFLTDDILSIFQYDEAREKGPICERCDNYHAMTDDFKDATDEEFEVAKAACKFARDIHTWWQKDKKINFGVEGDFYSMPDEEENKRGWIGTKKIAEWYRKEYGTEKEVEKNDKEIN